MTSAPGVSICVDDYEEQDIKGNIFSVQDLPYNNKLILRHTDNGPTPLFMFVPDPFQVVDFISYNTTMSATGFRQKRTVNLRTETGAKSVDGDIFRTSVNGVFTETPIPTKEDAFRILSDEFGMILTEPLKDIAVIETPPA
jgi:hypothetical protein